MIRPHYRGPNVRPEACASDLAVQDVLDAVEYAQNNARVDPRRVYLVGCSGGGHMALTLAHRYPEQWAAVSVWGAQTNLFDLHRQSQRIVPRYVRNLHAVCGGPPGTEATDREYRKRSPLFHLDAAKDLPIDINAGIHDGYEGPVTIDHSLRAFNVLARANGHAEQGLSDEQVQYMVKEQKVPSSLTDTWERDIRRRTPILFRRSAGPVRLTIFDGEHEIDYYAAVLWLSQQPSRPASRTRADRSTDAPADRG
jgi:pimeloyl-ACP methyl ester carboxylesterase